MRLASLMIIFAFGCTPNDRYVSYHTVWLDKPTTLEICDDLNVNHERAIEQVNWFYLELDSSYPYFYEDDIVYSDCEMPAEYGTIRVKRAETGRVVKDTAAAWAEYQYDYVTIEDPPGSYNSYDVLSSCTLSIGKLNTDWVIRHEFGHCWGWDHTESDHWSHLMSPWVGRSLEGLDQMPHEEWVNWEL